MISRAIEKREKKNLGLETVTQIRCLEPPYVGSSRLWWPLPSLRRRHHNVATLVAVGPSLVVIVDPWLWLVVIDGGGTQDAGPLRVVCV
jgi:hypothetical protein